MTIATSTAETIPVPAQAAPARKNLRGRAGNFLWSRQPKLIPTLMVAIMLPVLFGLGTWQIERLHQKNALIETVRSDLAQPPADLRLRWPQTPSSWSDLNYNPVTLQGKWLTVQSFKLSPRTYEGQAGYQLIMPLRLKDDQIVLVDRGFVPDGATMMPPKESDRHEAITGIARVMETKKPFGMPENIPAHGQWVWADLEAMGHETGFARTAPVMIYETRDPSRDTYPIGGQLPLPLENNHWHYAATWYAFALILMGVYLMSMNPKQDKVVDDTVKKPADDHVSDPVARRGLYPEATD